VPGFDETRSDRIKRQRPKSLGPTKFPSKTRSTKATCSSDYVCALFGRENNLVVRQIRSSYERNEIQCSCMGLNLQLGVDLGIFGAAIIMFVEGIFAECAEMHFHPFQDQSPTCNKGSNVCITKILAIADFSLQQIDDTVGVMRENINKVSQRGERLDALQDKTDNLAVSAQGFRRGANRVRKQMWWKDMKMRMCIIAGIIILLVIIIVPSGKISCRYTLLLRGSSDSKIKSSTVGNKSHVVEQPRSLGIMARGENGVAGWF
jgi:hypothetical protein